MAEHEPCIGATSDWRSPPEYFGPKAIDLVFDMDVASPGLDKCFVPAKACFTIEDDGLKQPWLPSWLVFMNPPFGGRNGHVPWLEKFLRHANGIAIVRAYTSSGWFHEHVVPPQVLLFPRGKTKFVRPWPDNSIGTAPGHGVVLIGMGEVACTALRKSGLGFCAVIEPNRVQSPLDWHMRETCHV
jgi:hypothetical protein